MKKIILASLILALAAQAGPIGCRTGILNYKKEAKLANRYAAVKNYTQTKMHLTFMINAAAMVYAECDGLITAKQLDSYKAVIPDLKVSWALVDKAHMADIVARSKLR